MTGRASGRFITLEGGEGAGKSVQAGRLEQRLAALGLRVVRTREPGGSPGAEALREAILSGFAAEFGPAAQALMFAAARVDHLDKTILPALASGAWVVSDRFVDSTRAYQGAAGNLPPDFIASLERLTVGANRSDLTLILDLKPEVGLERAAKRRQGGGLADRFELEGLPFHRTLRRAFLDIAAAEPWRCAVIDASGSEGEVAAAIWSAVETRLDPAGALKANRA
jgi:dTMP kinase